MTSKRRTAGNLQVPSSQVNIEDKARALHHLDHRLRDVIKNQDFKNIVAFESKQR